MFKKILKNLPFHPLLFSAYPILALLALNMDQIGSTAAIRSLIATCTLAVVMGFLLNLMIKNWHRSALIVSLFFILFFAYGHLYHYLESHTVLGFNLGRHRMLIMIWLFLGILGVWAVIKKIKHPQKITEGLNFISIVLVSMPIFMLLSYSIRLNTSQIKQSSVVTREGEISLQSSPQMPDIYYIVLDAYARQDVLKENYGYDNSAFISELERMGFYVARCGQSNYGLTYLSIASTLNMDYLDQISEGYFGGKMDMIWVPDLIKQNATRRSLKQLGYTDVSFENGFDNLLWDDADVIYRKYQSDTSQKQSFLNANGFEIMLLNQSAFLFVTDTFSILFDRFLPIKNYPANVHRDKSCTCLKSLPPYLQTFEARSSFMYILPHRTSPLCLVQMANS